MENPLYIMTSVLVSSAISMIERVTTRDAPGMETFNRDTGREVRTCFDAVCGQARANKDARACHSCFHDGACGKNHEKVGNRRQDRTHSFAHMLLSPSLRKDSRKHILGLGLKATKLSLQAKTQFRVLG